MPLAALVLTLLIGCRQLPWNARAIHACPGELVPTQEIAGDFLLRLHLRVSSEGGSFGFELAVQKVGDELVLVGLHPLGAKLFTLRQTGTDVRVEAHPAPALEVPPENILRDVHRVRFLALPPPAADGVVQGRRGTREIREHWEAGRLRERRFFRTGDGEATAEIAFTGTDAAGDESAVLRHHRCGYRSEFRTLSLRSLP